MSTEKKSYKLLKDLPNIKAGKVVKLSNRGVNYCCQDNNGHTASLSRKLVESNPEWFELVTEYITLQECVDSYLNKRGLIKSSEPFMVHSDWFIKTADGYTITVPKEVPKELVMKIKITPNPSSELVQDKKISDYEIQTYGVNLFANEKLPTTKEQEVKKEPCCICGGKTVLIRGKYPNTPERNICPTCTTERLEQIQEISSPDYGKTSKA